VKTPSPSENYGLLLVQVLIPFVVRDTEQPRISFRNYDPQTRTVKKGGVQDENDTIEKNVEGVAEKIIEEDNIRRAQDLVSP
jgi:hypothetical protein